MPEDKLHLHYPFLVDAAGENHSPPSPRHPVTTKSHIDGSRVFWFCCGMTPDILIGKSGDALQTLPLKYANRHGLVAGATGTGKTLTLQVLAEGFSRAGVPVFAADVKGDLSGIAAPGQMTQKLQERLQKTGLPAPEFGAAPVVFWGLQGKLGHPVRTTISEMGPMLLARLLDLTEAQEGVLTAAFRIADAEQMLLLDLKDLQAMLAQVAENADSYNGQYGNLGKASVGAVQRQLMLLEQQGANGFFGEPALDIHDFFRTTSDGRGVVNLLAAESLIQSPGLYATFLLWLLSELFETLPEAGDLDRPKLLFFFDEAHLLFKDAPKALLDKVTQVVRLIRSKGVGIYFVTQNPQDIPEDVLGQLGNKVQHALRAFTPKDQKAVKVAAQSFRANPDVDTETAIMELGVGEALVSTLQEGGIPGIVQRTMVAAPGAQIGALDAAGRQRVMAASPLAGKYDQDIDRESAYEMLNRKAATPVTEQVQETVAVRRTVSSGGGRQGYMETAAKTVIRTVASQVGRQIVRGILGAMLKR